MVRFCASLRLFVCPVLFLSIKIVSKIQTKPVRLGPIVVLNTHTGHDTVEDDTHSFFQIKSSKFKATMVITFMRDR